MVLTLEPIGLIRRQPGARSIEVLVALEHLPILRHPQLAKSSGSRARSASQFGLTRENCQPSCEDWHSYTTPRARSNDSIQPKRVRQNLERPAALIIADISG